METSSASFAWITFSSETGELLINKKNEGFGSQQFIITATDDGGTFGGGVDTYSQEFTLTINPINDPPYANPSDPISLSGVFYTGNVIDIIYNQTGAGSMYDYFDNIHAIENGYQIVTGDMLSWTFEWEMADDDQGANLVALDEDSEYYLLTPQESHRYIRAKLTASDNPCTKPAIHIWFTILANWPLPLGPNNFTFLL